MIKLKDIISEKKQLNEKKELPPGLINMISKMTDQNNHTKARFELAKRLKNKKFMDFYKALGMMNDVFNGYPPELQKLNHMMEKDLYKQLLRTYSNYDDIYNAL